MNFVKCITLWTFVLSLNLLIQAFADDALPFSAFPDEEMEKAYYLKKNKTALEKGEPAKPLTTAERVQLLKHKAVLNFLSEPGLLGANHPALSELSEEQTDKYIVDYNLQRENREFIRNGQKLLKPTIKIEGHLNETALRHFANILQAKTSGSPLHPYIIISSSLAELPLSAKNTLSNIKESLTAKALVDGLNSNSAGFGLSYSIIELNSLSLSSPARTRSEISLLRRIGEGERNNGAIWFHLQPCKSCGGARLETYFYNLTTGRLMISDFENLKVAPNLWTNFALIEKLLEQPLKEISQKVQSLVAKGTFGASNYILSISGVPSPKEYKELFKAINEQKGYITQATIKKTNLKDKNYAFEITTRLDPQNLSTRLSQTNFGNFVLRPMDVSSSSVAMQFNPKDAPAP